METKFVVIDVDGMTSYSADKEAPEDFASYRAAERRAKDLAHANPGQIVGIYELTGEVVYPLGEVQSTRKHPTEHYKK